MFVPVYTVCPSAWMLASLYVPGSTDCCHLFVKCARIMRTCTTCMGDKDQGAMQSVKNASANQQLAACWLY